MFYFKSSKGVAKIIFPEDIKNITTYVNLGTIFRDNYYVLIECISDKVYIEMRDKEAARLLKQKLLANFSNNSYSQSL